MEHVEAKSLRPVTSSRVSKWTGLVFGFCLVWLFMFVIAPWLQKIPMVNTLTTYVHETGIDASALYYTEIEEAAMAELGTRGTMEYPPRGQQK